MDKIEIPPFLLNYFDSHTIRSPLSIILGYSQAMLKGVDGPLNEEMQKDLQIIHKNADWLFQYWSFATKVAGYITNKDDAHISQIGFGELKKRCLEILNRYPSTSVEMQIPEEPLAVWADMQHFESMFDFVGRLTRDIYHPSGGKLIVRVLKNFEAATFEFEMDQTEFTKKEDFDLLIEPYIFVLQRIAKLHDGSSKLTNSPDGKFIISLVFPDVSQPKSIT